MSWTNAFYKFLVDAFRPPFRTAHWLALAYVILSIIYNPGSHFNRWVLPDTDDYVRFVQVFNWMGGQSWFDLRLPQLYPEHIISMHWARLVDVPLAGLLLLLQALSNFFQWETDKQGLAMLVAFIMPMLLLICMLLLVRALARPLVGKRYAGLACYFVPLSVQLMFQFIPMRVDHHAYILLFSAFSFLCLQRISLGLKPLRMAALAGVSFALGLWNGSEIMPVLGAFSICLSLILLCGPRRTQLAGLVFGAVLLAATFLVLLIAVAPEARWEMPYDSFSFFTVILTLYAFVFFIVLTVLLHFVPHKGVNLAALAFTGLALLAHLLSRFPDFVGGPYAQASPLLQHLFLNNIREAVPLWKSFADMKDGFNTAPNQVIGGALYFLMTRLFGPVIGLLTSIVQLLNKKNAPRARRLWLVFACFNIIFLGLGLFWQVRVMSYAQLFGIVPLLWLMLRYMKILPKHYSGRALFGWEILTVLSFTILPTIIVPSIILQSKMNPDMMFYLGNSQGMPCAQSGNVNAYLRALEKDEKKTFTIMSQLDYAPQLMFETNHSFIAAPYHRNHRGIIDMVMFFRSRADDMAARSIATRNKVDYVLICKKSYVQGTLDNKKEVGNYHINIDAKGNVSARPPENEIKISSLGYRLAYDVAPTWLSPVAIPFEQDFALFKINKDKLARPSQYNKSSKN